MLDEPGPVTVCGIGGAGKTRLSIEVARGFRTDKVADRVCWVPLAAAASSAEVAPAIGNALGLGGSPSDYLGQIRAVLGTGRALLVLDNCEHVALGCRELLDRILPDCPQLSVLTTSRIPLGMAGERIYTIPPLDMIGAGHDPNADGVGERRTAAYPWAASARNRNGSPLSSPRWSYGACGLRSGCR
jgi:predicted ATPase